MISLYSPGSIKVALSLLLFIISTVSAAQSQIAFAPVKRLGTTVTCYVGGEPYQLTPDRRRLVKLQFAPDEAETQKVFNEVEPYTDLTINVYALPVKDDINVQICPSDDGMNFIAYSPDWLERIHNETSSKWALYAIIAHEIGHYVKNHDRTRVKSDPTIELEADNYAGQVLAKMGASLSQARAAYNSDLLKNHYTNLFKNHHPETHPPIEQRLAAVKEGWLSGKAMMSAAEESASTDSDSCILRGPVKSNHAVYLGGSEFRFKVGSVQFNTHDSLRKAADDLTDEAGSHAANDRMYYWTREDKEDRLLLAWANVATGKFGWVVVENHRGNWYYKSNADTEWTLINRGTDRIKISWASSGQGVQIRLYVPKLCGNWTVEDIQYGFGNSN